MVLKKQFLDHGGLDYLCKAVLASDHPRLQNYAINGLTHLLKHTVIKWPSSAQSVDATLQKHGTWTQDASSYNPDVVFNLDDGTKVKGHRSTLSSRSQVFGAMLDGHYSESDQSEINIPGVDAIAFQILIGYLHGRDIRDILPESYLADDKLDILLETIVLSDSYMLPELMIWVENWIYQNFLIPQTIVKIMQVASLHGCHWLARQCVCNLALSATASHAIRQQCWTNFFQTFGQTANELLRAIIIAATS